MTTDPPAPPPEHSATPDKPLELATAGRSRDLSGFLTHIAHLAAAAVHAADGVGVTLTEPNKPDVIVGTSDLVRAVDAIQYGGNQGPCISATATGHTKRSGSLATEPAWPDFGRRAAQLGVHSVLSVPLIAEQQMLGSLNLYSGVRDAFDDHAVELAEAFAGTAAISVRNAQALFSAQQLAAHLQTTLTTRAVVDQAIGITMSRTGMTADDAIDQLRTASRNRGQALHAVAQHLIDQTTRAAEAAPSEPDNT